MPKREAIEAAKEELRALRALFAHNAARVAKIDAILNSL